MSKKLILSSLVALFVFISSPNTSHAQIVTFDLPSTNGPFDFGDDVGQFIDPVTGLVADFAAFVDGSSGEFNATAGNFGINACLLYTSPSPRDKRQSRMPSSA